MPLSRAEIEVEYRRREMLHGQRLQVPIVQIGWETKGRKTLGYSVDAAQVDKLSDDSLLELCEIIHSSVESCAIQKRVRAIVNRLKNRLQADLMAGKVGS